MRKKVVFVVPFMSALIVFACVIFVLKNLNKERETYKDNIIVDSERDLDRLIGFAISTSGELVLQFENGVEKNVGYLVDKKNEHVQKVSVNGNKCLTLTYSNKKVVNVGKLLGEYSQEGVGIKELKFDDDGQAHLLLTNDTTLDVYCALGECDGENVVGVKIEDSHLFLVYSDKRTIDVGKLVKKEDL